VCTGVTDLGRMRPQHLKLEQREALFKQTGPTIWYKREAIAHSAFRTDSTSYMEAPGKRNLQNLDRKGTYSTPVSEFLSTCLIEIGQ
jgi:hypothetical protein